jgi:hypothetical protein
MKKLIPIGLTTLVLVVLISYLVTTEPSLQHMLFDGEKTNSKPWKRYVNHDNKFSLSYPGEWNHYATESKDTVYLTPDSPSATTTWPREGVLVSIGSNHDEYSSLQVATEYHEGKEKKLKPAQLKNLDATIFDDNPPSKEDTPAMYVIHNNKIIVLYSKIADDKNVVIHKIFRSFTPLK